MAAGLGRAPEGADFQVKVKATNLRKRCGQDWLLKSDLRELGQSLNGTKDNEEADNLQ